MDPVRKIVTGQTFAEITTSIRVSNDHKEAQFIDNWQRLVPRTELTSLLVIMMTMLDQCRYSNWTKRIEEDMV